jgi:hypothetical protein
MQSNNPPYDTSMVLYYERINERVTREHLIAEHLHSVGGLVLLIFVNFSKHNIVILILKSVLLKGKREINEKEERKKERKKERKPSWPPISELSALA